MVLVWPIPTSLIGDIVIVVILHTSGSVADNTILVLLVVMLLKPSSTWYPVIGTLSSV